jgi:hypothetical protein
MTDEVASGDGTISDQTALIAQIAQALEGKLRAAAVLKILMQF